MAELYHYNHNHDPRTGKFTTSSNAVKLARRANRIYNSLTDDEKKLVMGTEKKPPAKYTTPKEYKRYAVRTIQINDKGKPISTFDIWKENEDEVAVSIMTRSGDKYRGKGYATKAAQRGIEYLESSDFKKAYWDVNINNAASIAVAKELGFKRVKEMKNDPVWDTYVLELHKKH